MIKEQFDADFKPITTSQWILDNIDKFDLSKTEEKVTFHDACMLSRLENQSENPRKIINEIAELVEMEDNRENSLCCGGMRARHNTGGVLEFRNQKLINTKKTGVEKMITECITCWEKYNPLAKAYGMEVEDIVATVHKNLKK
jgi:Fe-S oxidoreductase